MKKLLLFLLLGTCIDPLFAQDSTQTVQFTTEIDTVVSTKKRRLDTYGDVFQTQVPVRSVFKIMVPVDLLRTLNGAQMSIPRQNGQSVVQQLSDVVRIGYEQKLSTAWSINAEAALTWNSTGGVSYVRGERGGLYSTLYPLNVRILLQPRWYYRMNRRIREGKSVNNVSDNYLGLSLERRMPIQTESPISPYASRPSHSQEVALVYGLQRRFGKRGFADFTIRAGVASSQLYSRYLRASSWEPFIETRSLIGFAFAGQSQSISSRCELFHCFEPVRSIWKVDLNNPIRWSPHAGHLRTTVAYEYKLGASPFSVQGEWSVYGKYQQSERTYGTDYPYAFRDHLLQGGIALESRYYYNLKSRINRGKQSDNLSGSFITLGISSERLGNRIEQREGHLREGEKRVWSNHHIRQTLSDGYLAWGTQRRLFSNGFFELKAGVRLPLSTYAHNTYQEKRWYQSGEQQEVSRPSNEVYHGRAYSIRSTAYGFVDLKVGLAWAKRK